MWRILVVERGLSIFENYPLVDAVVQPNILIQITVSPNSHKGAVHMLEEIRGKLKEKDKSKHKMIFVVPQRNVKTFKFQEDLQDISQFSTTDTEVASELSLLSESELRVSKKAKTSK
jgi:hypothetical protein